MNNRYSIEKIFGELSSLNDFRVPLDENNYKDYLNKYIEIANPDFVAIITTKSMEPIVFEKNYNLKFQNNKSGTLQDIIDSANTSFTEISNKILELDSEMFKFVFEYPELIEPKKNLYSIKSPNELIPNNIISLRRDIIVLSKDEDGLPHILLAAWFDVTEFYGTKPEILVNVKDFSDKKKVNDSIRLELNEKLNNIVSPQIILTKREKEILHLISEGKTSEQIANQLNISKKTVDKHRQNIIKKNNASNTSALLRSI